MVKNNLRIVLESEAITQEWLARESGLSTGTVNKIANQKARPAPTTIRKIVKGLNILSKNSYSITDLFPESEESRSSDRSRGWDW